MKKLSLIFLFFLIAQGCKHPLFSLNYRDKLGKRQGLWKVNYGDGSLYTRTRYKNNIPKRKMRYYYPNGNIMLVERYKKKSNEINAIYYHQNGVIELIGKANFNASNDSFSYHWKGEWQKFDTTGKLIEINTYRYGQQIWSKKINLN